MSRKILWLTLRDPDRRFHSPGGGWRTVSNGTLNPAQQDTIAISPTSGPQGRSLPLSIIRRSGVGYVYRVMSPRAQSTHRQPLPSRLVGEVGAARSRFTVAASHEQAGWSSATSVWFTITAPQ